MAAVLASVAASAWAAPRQSATATVHGGLRDVSGAVLPNATITLTRVDTGHSRAPVRSDRDGSFRFLALAPGPYRLEVALDGFAPAVRTFEVTVDLDYQLSLTLTVAPLSDSVSVLATELPLVEPSKTSLGSTITRKDLDGAPIMNGTRTFATLAMLAPGIQNDLAGAIGMGTAGLIGSQTVQVDGLSIDKGTSETSGTPPLEAIQEFKVVTNHSSAEFGQASGAVISVLTRSGTNAPSGRLYWLQQEGAWAATSAKAKQQQTTDPGLTQKIFGGTWGGPLVRNRAFLFGTAEQMVRKSVYINTSPVARLFRPNDPLTIPFRVTLPRALVRADVNLSASNVATLRYNYQLATHTNAGREPTSTAERSRVLHNSSHDLAVLDTHAFGARVVNEMRAHWDQYRWLWTVDDFCPGCAALNYRNIRLGKPPPAPSSEARERGDLVETVSWLAAGPGGRHAIKTGLAVSFARFSDATLNNGTGTYTFGHDIPFDPANPLSYPTQFTQNVGNPGVVVQETIVSFFAQDEWQPREGLSINFSARWDHTRWPGPSSRRDDVAPRLGVSIDPSKKGTTVFRAGAGRYYDESGLEIARAAETGFTMLSIAKPGFQGDAVHFDPYGFHPTRSGSAVALYSVNRYTSTETPYTDQASVGLQKQVGARIGVAIDLVRARGHHLPSARDLNYPDLTTGARPSSDRSLKQIIVAETTGESWYTGLQVGVQRRHASHYGYVIAYTWSSSENDTSGTGAMNFPQDQTKSLLVERGPTLLDARHQFSASGTMDTPFGLRVAAVIYTRSALPYNVTIGVDSNNDGVANNDRPPDHTRNDARGAPLFEADVRLSKFMHVGGKRIELLAEVFNATNHDNWTSFTGTPGEFFGRANDAGPPRQFQVGVRFDFGAGGRR
jgi:hypothetical protein